MVFLPEEHLQDLLQRSSPPLSAVRVVSGSLTTPFSDQRPRQKRWLLQLLHARRGLADLVRLTQRSELDVAFTLARFFRWGYIELVSKNLSQWVSSLIRDKGASRME